MSFWRGSNRRWYFFLSYLIFDYRVSKIECEKERKMARYPVTFVKTSIVILMLFRDRAIFDSISQKLTSIQEKSWFIRTKKFMIQSYVENVERLFFLQIQLSIPLQRGNRKRILDPGNTRQKIIPLSTNRLASMPPLFHFDFLSRYLKEEEEHKDDPRRNNAPSRNGRNWPRKSGQVSDVSRLAEACQRELDGFRFIDNLYRRCC